MNKSKFSIKSDNDKKFEQELEKAAQAVYGKSYHSLQELPGNNEPSKHYLRKQYIKNKKFIGLPNDLKQKSNTNIYKSEQRKIIIESYNIFKKEKSHSPTVSQLMKFMNEKFNINKDNRKLIKKVIEEKKLHISIGKNKSNE